METIYEDWKARKLIKIYKEYYSPLKERASREGRANLMHSFGAVLEYERLSFQRVDKSLDPTAKEPAYFLLTGQIVVNIVYEGVLNEETAHNYLVRGRDKTIVLNFAGQKPEWYPFEPEEHVSFDGDALA